jgi:DnaJ-class molecular chaperone
MTSKWTICPTCDGDGSHSRRLGVVNPQEWDPEEFEQYMEGGYDEPCGTCGGSGKISREQRRAAMERHERQLCYERGVNEAGEPL